MYLIDKLISILRLNYKLITECFRVYLDEYFKALRRMYRGTKSFDDSQARYSYSAFTY